MKREFLSPLKEKIKDFQEGELSLIFKKSGGHIAVVIGVILLSILAEVLPSLLKKDPPPVSLSSLIPKNFVLVPIEIVNGRDIINMIGGYGLVDLYSYSEQTGLPERQAGSAVKILPPQESEGRFMALIPEAETSNLFSHPDSFYAVIQNPDKKREAKIYKKKHKKPLVIIEEGF